MGNHEPDHAYYVVPGDHIKNICYHGQPLWKQLSLLDSSRTNSVGSWEKVCEKTQMESSLHCEGEFTRIYSLWKQICKDTFPELKYAVALSPIEAVVVSDDCGIEVPAFSVPRVADMPGFMKNRGDFDVEYDDSAELALADIEIHDDEPAEELGIKLVCLHAYNDRMRRREEVKNFVFTSNLTNIQGQLDAHSCRTAEEIELRGKLRPIERHFSYTNEFESFVQLILMEQRLIERIRSVRKSTGAPIAEIKLEGDENVKETSERLVTRSRSGNEQRRGRSVEEGCSRISDALESASLVERIRQDLDPIESETVEKVGIDPVAFALIRDVIQRRAIGEGSTSIEASISRSGGLVLLNASLN